jgi:NADH:ubiquinone oxidoreductase subunit F (NADH-binding)
MNSDEYLGGMSSDRPLKALVPGGSSVPILPADLIYKTANGEDRLMTYESLSDGFATGSMLGSEVSLCIMTLLAYAILGTLLVLSSRKLWTMLPMS